MSTGILKVVSNELINSGQITAAGKLTTTASSLTNSGSLYSGGQQTLQVSGAMVQTGSGTVAAAQDLTVTADSLSSSVNTVIASGMAQDGKLTGNGALRVTTTNALQTSGQALATGALTLSGSSLDLSNSTTGSTSAAVSLTASSGHITTQAAQLSTPGLLTINANTSPTQTLNNTSGHINAGQLMVRVGEIDNTQGLIQQTDTHAALTTIESTNGVNNTRGSILANSQALTLSTGQALNNTDGLISAKADLNLTSAELTNTASGNLQTPIGIQSQEGQVTIAAASLTNSSQITAAGKLTTTASSLTNSGSLYSGGQQTLQVSGAMVQTGSGTVAAAQDLTVTADSLSSSANTVIASGMAQDGKLTGNGALRVTTTNALQTSGQALATGALTLSGSSLDLSNSTTGSTSAAVSLTASSGHITTQAAQLSTPGLLTINANTSPTQTLNNTSGHINAGQLMVRVGEIDNTQGLIQQTDTHAALTTIESTNGVNNTRGSILANSQALTLSTGQALNNTDGLISHAGTGALSLSASSINNTRGQVLGSGSTSVDSSGSLVNTDGLISAKADLNLTSAELTNTASGNLQTPIGIQSQEGQVTIAAANLTNSSQITAAGKLTTTASSLTNSGSLYSGGQQTLQVSGAMVQTGSGTVAAAQDLTVTADSLSSSANTVIASGMAQDGKLTGNGALRVTTTNALQTSGQALATGALTLSSSSLDLSNSTTGSTSAAVSLTASSGHITTQAAQLSTPGLLTINANTAANQTLNNTSGHINAGQLMVRVGEIDNTQGLIQQTDTHAALTTIESTNGVNNTRGSILANSQALTLSTGQALNNTDGLISHAGTGALSLSASSINNTRGQVLGSGSTSVDSSGSLVNTDGLISAKADLNLTSAELTNTASGNLQTPIGIQSQEGQVTIAAASLTNSSQITAAGKLTTTASSLTNSGSLYSGGQQTLQVSGAMVQTGSGTVAAAQDLTVTADSLSSSANTVIASGMAQDGKLTSNGALRVTTTNALQTSGQALATGALTLSGSSLDLSNSTTGSTSAAVSLTASSGHITTQAAQLSTPGLLTINANTSPTQTLNNTSGHINAGQLMVRAGEIDNTQGLIQQTDTHAALTTIESTNGVNNTRGSILANSQALTLSTGQALNNTDGLISHAGTGALSLSASSINNTRGQVLGSGSTSVDSSGSLVNTDGLISAKADLNLTSAELTNTASGNLQTPIGIQSQEGQVTIAAANLTNSSQITAAGKLTTTASSLTNSGSLYSGGQQTLQVSGAMVQTGSGTVAAAQDLTVTADSLSSSANTVIASGMAQDGKLTSNGALRVTTTNALQTSGQALATGALTLSGSSLDLSNSTTGSTSAAVSLTASSGHITTQAAQLSTPGLLTINANTAANQTLNNTSGHINAGQLMVRAGEIDNTQGLIQQTDTHAALTTIESTNGVNNTRGSILANSQALTLSTGQALNNTDGLISHAGTGALSLSASSINNTRGQVLGSVSTSVDSSGSLVNTDGLISAKADLNLTSAELTNTASGNLQTPIGIQSQEGQVTIAAASLTNSSQITAAGKLTTTASSLTNSGSLYSGGQQTLQVSGAMVQTGSGTVAAAQDLTVTADSLSSSANTVIASGMAQDGKLTGNGALRVTTTNALQTSGQALATGALTLSGSSLDLSNSTTGSTSAAVSLTASSGHITTQAAQLSTPGLLTINANTSPTQTLNNTSGHINAGQLMVRVGEIDNTQGLIQQTDTHAALTTIESTNGVNNTRGSILANSQALTLSTGQALNNTDGLISHAGTGALSLSASSINNTRGQVLGSGSTSVDSSGSLVNTDGLISAKADLNLTSAELTNTASGNLQTPIGIQSQEGQVTIAAASLTNSSQITAAGKLTTTASSLTNSGSLYSGGQQTLQVSGAMVQTGSGTVAAAQDLTVTADSLSSSANTVIASGMAQDGKLTGNGALRVTTTNALQTSGQALATGALTLSGSSLDLSNSTTGSTSAAVSLTASSGHITTQAAQLSTPGLLTINANTSPTQTLNNTSGHINAGQLMVRVGEIDNTQGLIQQTDTHAALTTIESTNGVNNTRGSILANSQALTLSTGQALNNTDGLISHAGTGALSLSASSINNTRGQVLGSGSTSVDSSGSLVNTDGLISAKADLNLTSAELTNTASGNLQTPIGIQSQEGQVTIAATNLTNSSQITAAGKLTTTASSLTNSGSLYSGGQQTLQVSGAMVQTGSGTVAAAQDLTVTADSLSSSANTVIASGMAQDGKLTGNGALRVTTTNALQTSGQALATGALTLSGSSLDLSNSTTGSTSAAVSLTASSGHITTQAAQLSTPGLLTINANTSPTQTLNNTSGHINAGQLMVRAGEIDNTQGLIQQTDTHAALTTIESTNGVNNTRGSILANSQALTLSTGQALNNTDGLISHAGTGALSLSASSINNTRGQVLGSGSTSVDSSGQFNNSVGLVASQGTLDIHSGSLSNQGGKLVSVQDDVSIAATQGGIYNQAGLIQSAKDLNLSVSQPNDLLQNSNGKIIAGQNATLLTGSLNNDAGLIASSKNLSLNTNGKTLSNVSSRSDDTNAPLGLIAGSMLDIQSGALDNRAGLMSGQTGVRIVSSGSINSAAFNGNASQIYSGSDLQLHGTGIHNSGSQILAIGNASLNAGSGSLNNSAGLIRSGQALTLTANAIDNTNTLGTTVNSIPTPQGLEGKHVSISTTNLHNAQGAVRAAQNLTILSDGQINNAQGELSAGAQLQINALQASTPSLSINNEGGKIIADQSVTVRTATLSGAGTVSSKGDVSLSLQGNHTLAGTLQAGRHLQLQTTGILSNPISIEAGQNLSVNASDLENLGSGRLIGGQTTQIQVNNTLNNRGLIDGTDTRIQGGTVNNLGTGRIYGDRVAIKATSLNNKEESVAGITTAATIAGRERVDLGASIIVNRENALIYSAGDMAIGGTLDANHRVTGSAQSLRNGSATIDAEGNLNLAANAITNANDHFQTQAVVTHQYGLVSGYTTFDRTITEYKIVEDKPAQITAGGNITFTANAFTNQQSKVIAGGALTGNGSAIENTQVLMTKTTNDAGTTQSYEVTGRYKEWYKWGYQWRNTYGWVSRPYSASTTDSIVISNGISRYNLDPNSTAAQQLSTSVAASTVANPPLVNGSSPTDTTIPTVQTTATAVGVVNSSTNTVTVQNVSGTDASSGNASQAIQQAQSQVQTGTAQAQQAQSQNTNDQTNQQVLTVTTQAQNAQSQNTNDQTNQQVLTHTAQAQQAQSQNTNNQTNQQVLTVTAQAQQAQSQSTNGQTNQQVLSHTAPSQQAQSQNTNSQTNQQVLTVTAQAQQAQGQNTQNHTGQTIAVSQQSAQSNAAPNRVNALVDIPQIQIRTIQPNMVLPNSSLFIQHPEVGATYLIETDPQFTQYQLWLSSEYMTKELKLDPAMTQKRLGDGFYEQRLIREQIQALTGQRFIGNYTNDEQQFKALMDSGITHAKALNLRPGIALSAEQLMQLTSDMVWLVTKEVTLANGSKQSVLVPQVYVRLRPGDLDGSGALLAGSEIQLNVSGDAVSSGTIAGRNLVQINAENIKNLGGQINADVLAMQATQNIDNVGGVLQAQSMAQLSAGRDLNLITSTQSTSGKSGALSYSQTGIERVAGLYVTGAAAQLIASAGRDVNLTGVQIENRGTGSSSITAGNNLNLNVVTTSKQQDFTVNANNYVRSNQSQDVGTQITTGGALSLKAGNDLNAKAANVSAADSLSVQAGRDILITAGQTSQSEERASQQTQRSLISKSTTTTASSSSNTLAMGSSFTGDSVSMNAGRDLGLQGSNVLARADIDLTGNRSVVLEAATNTTNSSSSQTSQRRTLGIGTGGGGSRTASNTQLVGSGVQAGGNVTIKTSDTQGLGIVVAASGVKAGGNLSMDSAAGVAVVSQKNLEQSRSQSNQRGLIKAKSGEAGEFTETAATATLSAGQNLSVSAKGAMEVVGATLKAGETMSLGGVKVKRDENGSPVKDANGQYVADDGAAIQSLKVTQLDLSSKSWNEQSSRYVGVAGQLGKAASTFASVVTNQDISIQMSQSSKTSVERTAAQETQIEASTVINKSLGNTEMQGVNLNASKLAYIDAQKISITGAQERTSSSTSTSGETFSSSGAQLQKDRLQVAGVKDTLTTNTQTSGGSTVKNATLNTGQLVLKSKEGIDLLSVDAKVSGDLDVTAGGSVKVGGLMGKSETSDTHTTKTTEVSVGVRNAYLDTARSVQELDKARKTVDQANTAYKQAQDRIAKGELAPQALDDYKLNLAAATANLAQASLNVAKAGATAAASTATGGFTGDLSASSSTSSNSSTQTQDKFYGSNIQVGGNTSIKAGNRVDLLGSQMQLGGNADLVAQSINIVAVAQQGSTSSRSKTQGASGGISTSGNANVGVNQQNSRADSISTTWVQSGLTVGGKLSSKAEDTTIRGAQVVAGDLDVQSKTLTVASVQNTQRSTDQSAGAGMGYGQTTQGNNSGGSVNFAVNQQSGGSDSRMTTQQTQLIGKNSAVIKAESTTLIGATLASESNNLELRTNSLTAQNLDDYSKSNTSGFSVGAGSGHVNVAANRSGHEMQGQTLATIGAGRILRLDDGSDLSPALTASLNRDLTKAQIITKKQDTGGLNVTLTLDTRVLTADGRAAVKKDFVDSKEHAKEIVQAGKDVVNTELGVQDFAGRVNDLAQDRQVLAKTASNTDAVDKLRGDQAAKGSQEGAQTLSDKLAQAGEQKGSAQVLLYQGNQVATDDTRVNSTNDFNKNISNSGYNAKSDQTVINTAQVNMTDATQVVQAVAHENARRDMSTGGTGSNLGATDQTTLASTRGQRAAETFTAYADLNNQSTQGSSTQAQWNADNANSATIQTGNAVVAKMDSKEVKPWLYAYNGKIIARDTIDNNKIIVLSDKDKGKLAAKEPQILMKEIAGINSDAAPVVVKNENAKEMTSSTIYDLAKEKDRSKLQEGAGMGYINADDKNTRIYVQTGMNTKPEDAIKNAQTLSKVVGEPVGVIVNGTQGLGNDIQEYLPKAPSIKDALNEYTYQTLNKQGNKLVVMHSAGNEDANKALQLGQQLGHQYSNLSFLSLASPISKSVMRQNVTQTKAEYLGLVNDWRDPVTHPKLWVTGTVVLLAGGAVAGAALAPATGGSSLYAYGAALMGGGLGGGLGGGTIVYGINNYHPMDKYIAKPQTQSIMFNWQAKKEK